MATRYVGRLADWNDAKGFGFVEPHGGGERAFVHIKAFARPGRRPAGGELISYAVASDLRGRRNAVDVRYARAGAPAQARRSPRAWPRSVPGALLLAAVGVAGWTGRVSGAMTAVCLGMSAVALWLYARDKAAARDGAWRTQELTLHLVALLGGWPGALLAQGLFRHKSGKAAFQWVFWGTVAVNGGAVAWALSSGTLP